MHQPCPDPFVMFGSLDDLDFATDDRPTWPPPGTADLIIEDKYEPLFTSATWSLVAKVGDQVIGQSQPISAPHTAAFMKRWSRQLIRSNYERLRKLGVDAEAEYVKLGGELEDLKP